VDRSGDGWDQQAYWERHAAAAGSPDADTDPRRAAGSGAAPEQPDGSTPTPGEPPRRRPAWLSERVTFPLGSSEPLGASDPDPRGAFDPRGASGLDQAGSGAEGTGGATAAGSMPERPSPDYVVPVARDAVPVPREDTVDLRGPATDGDDDDSAPGSLRSLRSRLIRAGTTTVLVVAVATAVAYATRPERDPTAGDPGRPIYPVQESVFEPAPGVTDTPPPVIPTSDAPATMQPSPTAPPTAAPSTTKPAAAGPTTSAPSSSRPPTTAAPVVVTVPTAGQTVQLVNYGTGGYVGVAGNSTDPGNPVVQTYHASWSSTKWRLQTPNPAKPGCFVLIAAGTNKALDVRDAGLWNGAPMQVSTADGSSNQTWCFTAVEGGWFSLQNQHAYRLLDLRDGSTAEGATLQQWGAEAFRPNQNQTWRLLLVP